MRVRRVRLRDGGEWVAVWYEDRWVPLLAAGDDDASPQLRRSARDLVAFLGAFPDLRDDIEQAARRSVERAEEISEDGGALLPFHPRSFRDFSLWERHMVDAARGIARRFLAAPLQRTVDLYERASGRTFPRLRPPPLWYEHPIYYKGNHLAFVPDGAVVPWPSYTQALDYELELGVVLARPLHDASPDDALAAVGGFVVVGDWSARDVQAPEMTQGQFGPAKSKDFASSLGAVVVTADELLDRVGDLVGEVRVNGERWGEGSTAGMQHTLGEMLAYACLGERLEPGELLATGTLPGCSGVEADRWLCPGDVVELEIHELDTLRSVVGDPEPAAARGDLDRARWNVVPHRGYGPEVPAIDPARADVPPTRPLEGPLAPDHRLDEVERWELPGGAKPEDVLVDPSGRVYTGVADGRVFRFEADGSRAELVADTHGRPLGLEFDGEGRVVVCDAYRGLVRLDATGRVEVLADTYGGEPLRFANNAAVAPDGTIYFSDSSTRFDIAHYRLDGMEHRGNGRLFAYSPVSGTTELVLDRLYFPNGLALAPDASFLLIVETWQHHVRRLWLSGPRAGECDVLVDALPGYPDNMSSRGDGTFWIALANPRRPEIERLLPRPAARRAIAALPDRFHPAPVRASIVARFDSSGAFLDSLHGPAGTYAAVTGVREHAGHLYLGSLIETAIARVRLDGAVASIGQGG